MDDNTVLELLEHLKADQDLKEQLYLPNSLRETNSSVKALEVAINCVKKVQSLEEECESLRKAQLDMGILLFNSSEYIKKLESLTSDWIPFNEKLPNPGDEVLVTRRLHGVWNEDIPYTDDVAFGMYIGQDNEKKRPFIKKRDIEVNGELLAWMPLPSIYVSKEKGVNND